MRGVLGYRGLKKKIQTRSQLKRSSKKKKKKAFPKPVSPVVLEAAKASGILHYFRPTEYVQKLLKIFTLDEQ